MNQRHILAFSILAMLAACVHPGQNIYGSGEVGISHDIVLATIIHARPVAIKNKNTGIGLIGGGIAGGAAGSATHSGWATAGAALAGAVAGQVVENEVSNRDGVEYTVRLDTGKIKTIVQETHENDVIFKKGDRVMLQYCDAGDHYKKCKEGQDYQRVLPVPPELANIQAPPPKKHHRKKSPPPEAVD